MMSLYFLQNYAQVWLLAALIIIIYAAAKATKLVESNWVLWSFSILLSFLFFSSKNATRYMIESIPLITVLLVLGICLVLMLVLTAKDIGAFKRPIAVISFIIAIIVLAYLAFVHFHTLGHMLPGTSDSGLSSGAEDFKDFLYSRTFKDSFVLVCAIALVSFFILKKK